MFRYVHFIAYIILFIIVSGKAEALSQKDCLSDSAARVYIQEHKLIGLEQALSVARIKAKGDVISTSLCRVSDVFMYKIAIIGKDGRVVKLLVDAVSGNIVD